MRLHRQLPYSHSMSKSNVGPNDYYILLLLVFCHEISFSFHHVMTDNSVHSLLWPKNGVNLFGKDEKKKTKKYRRPKIMCVFSLLFQRRITCVLEVEFCDVNGKQ